MITLAEGKQAQVTMTAPTACGQKGRSVATKAVLVAQKVAVPCPIIAVPKRSQAPPPPVHQGEVTKSCYPPFLLMSKGHYGGYTVHLMR